MDDERVVKIYVQGADGNCASENLPAGEWLEYNILYNLKIKEKETTSAEDYWMQGSRKELKKVFQTLVAKGVLEEVECEPIYKLTNAHRVGAKYVKYDRSTCTFTAYERPQKP